MDKAAVLFERRPERGAGGRETGVIFFYTVQRAAFPLVLVPTSSAKAGGKMVRATLGRKFSLRAEQLHDDQMSNAAMRTEWWRGGGLAGRR